MTQSKVLAAPKTWEDFYKLGKAAGAKFPNVVAAQWALESGWGRHLSGKYNYFGIKATGNEPGTTKYTEEQTPSGQIYKVKAKFKDFESPQACVQQLVDQWYKDYTNPSGQKFSGINRASTQNEAADLLQKEGYATDISYPSKLKRLMSEHGIHENAPETETVTPFFLNAAKYYRGFKHQNDAYMDLWDSLTADQQQRFIRTYRTQVIEQPNPVPPYYYQRDNTIKPEASCQSAALAMAIEPKYPELFTDDDDYLHALENNYGPSESQTYHLQLHKSLGIKSSFLQNGTQKLLMDMLDDGYVVPMGILHHGPYKNPRGGGHWITAYDYDESGLLCHDPYGLLDVVNGGYIARGPTDGKSIHYKWQYIMARWDLGPGDRGWYWLIS